MPVPSFTKYCIVLLGILLAGCYRGKPKENPPIHLIPDMDSQPKYAAQKFSAFFEDGAAMRLPVPGTIKTTAIIADSSFLSGMGSDRKPLAISPVPVTMQLLKRGQERFNIYCSPCHSQIGDGKGIMIQHGYTPPPNFHDDYIRGVPDGHIFEVIGTGIRTMPSYANQIALADRWAIVSYIRALQRSQRASLQDIPVELRTKLK